MAQRTPIELPAPPVAGTGAGGLYFIGNATTSITYAGFTLLTDPAFMHKGAYMPLGRGKVGRSWLGCGVWYSSIESGHHSHPARFGQANGNQERRPLRLT